MDGFDGPVEDVDGEEPSSTAGRAPVSISEIVRCFNIGFIPPPLLLLLAELGVVEVDEGR